LSFTEISYLVHILSYIYTCEVLYQSRERERARARERERDKERERERKKEKERDPYLESVLPGGHVDGGEVGQRGELGVVVVLQETENRRPQLVNL
jgi:hypothetical protein